MYQRPKLGETDEDLLKLQKEFYKNKSDTKFEPAAKVVNAKKSSNDSEIVSNSPKAEEPMQVTPSEIIANTFETIPKMSLGAIKPNITPINLTTLSFNNSLGFPQAKRRDTAIQSTSGSIFSQQMKKQKPNTSPDPDNTPNTNFHENLAPKPEKLPEKSYILTGTDSTNLHSQNLDTMSKMTEEEILEEREKLMSTLDPAIIAFLKSKRYHNEKKEQNTMPDIKEKNQVDVQVEMIESAKEILENPKVESWLNFKKVESNKLAWMANCDLPEMIKNKQYEARFDFDGFLLPFTNDEITEKNRTLYHHGEEPFRPGYTLQELFQLCRSTVNQQKIIVLNTIANILSLNSTGIYDNIIEIPIEQIFFVLRFSLDENIPGVLNAAVKAIRNLIYSQIDEVCVDNMLSYGFFTQPILAVNVEDVEDDNTVNDQQLAELDLVKCLVRSGILIRIRYILTTIKPSSETIIYCLQILIRLARDSNFVLNKLCTEDNLLDMIITDYLTKSETEMPVKTQILKLLRVIFSRSREITEKLIKKDDIFDILTYYLLNETIRQKSDGIKLQIESFNVVSVLLHCKVDHGRFYLIIIEVEKALFFHVKTTNANNESSYTVQSHATALINCITNYFITTESGTNTNLLKLVNIAVGKWTSQFTKLTSFTCGKLQIISSILNLISSLSKIETCGLLEGIFDTINNLIQSSGFYAVTEEIRLGSNILNNFESHKTSDNLISMESAVWNNSEHAIPILQTTSCLPFLYTLTNCINTLQNTNTAKLFLNHPNIRKYLQLLNKSTNFYLTANWFTKIESRTILGILTISETIQNQIDTTPFYELAVKSLTIYKNEEREKVHFLLKNIIFCQSFYPTDVLIQNLQIGQENNFSRDLDDIFNVYSQVFGLETTAETERNLSENIKLGTIIPVDWIYTPILVLYGEQQHNTKNLTEEEPVYIVLNCLRWIYVYEIYFPKLADLINPTDRFCRLACLFLCSDTLFLVPEIKTMLQRCLEHLIKFKIDQFDFDRKIEGLNSFQDFYTQLLEQYQGVSYGDSLFGNFILIPLAQRQNAKLRKTLWSEYAGIVEIFNISQESIMCSPELFLEPAEEDFSLLKCYRRSLESQSVRRTSFLKTIAQHHCEVYIAKKRNAK